LDAFRYWFVVGIFCLTYCGLALGKLPVLRTDRAGIALVGAVAMLAAGILPLDQAVAAIDAGTILLLFGMMIVVGHLHLSGFFEQLVRWTLGRIRTPRALLAAIIGLAGLLSAFLVNDIVCVALAPLVVRLTRRLRINPVPHLLGLATASNIGSAATMTGNPQNMIIGGLSEIPYLRFALYLAPPAVLGLLVNYLLIAWLYRQTLTADPAGDWGPVAVPEPAPTGVPQWRTRAHDWLLWKSLGVTLTAVVLFCLGYPIAIVALAAAAVLLLGRVRPEKIYRQVDWGLLVMFCGLFIVVQAFRIEVVELWQVDRWRGLIEHPVTVLTLASAALSNLVSNVPAVLLFKPVISAMPATQQETAWLALAMSSTFAGNLTMLGSVANLIVVESARREGVHLSFREYCRVGMPLTVLTIGLGVAWLLWIR